MVITLSHDVMPAGDTITGDDTITVEAGDDTTTPPDMTASPVATTTPPDTTTPVGVSRELPTGPVAQGEKFTVTITGTGFGADFEIGQVEEILPAEFSYVDGSATKVVRSILLRELFVARLTTPTAELSPSRW